MRAARPRTAAEITERERLEIQVDGDYRGVGTSDGQAAGEVQMKITIIFPGRSLETAKATASVMPLAPCLLAALTPDRHQVSLVDMFYGDPVDYESDADVVAITVRTPLAPIAYHIAGKF